MSHWSRWKGNKAYRFTKERKISNQLSDKIFIIGIKHYLIVGTAEEMNMSKGELDYQKSHNQLIGEI